MLRAEVLIGELGAVYGLSARPVAVREVASLGHEARDDAVEAGAPVVQRLPGGGARAVLAGHQAAEILRGPGNHIGEQLEDHSPHRPVADSQVQENLGVRPIGSSTFHAYNKIIEAD